MIIKSQFKLKEYENGLYLVSTPLGNLKDITLRAIEVLQQSHYILCEDTRVTKKLLTHYKINKPLLRYVDDDSKINFYIDKLNSNDIALITDAGTPLLSDPGYKAPSSRINCFSFPA